MKPLWSWGTGAPSFAQQRVGWRKSSIIPSISASFAVLLCLAGCSVGPNYHRPSAPTTPQFKEAAGWQPANPMDQKIRGDWWQVFNDTELNSLEQQVAVSNQSLKVAVSQYAQARALVQYQRAQYFPFLSAAATATRTRGSENRTFYFAAKNQYNDFSLPLDLSWEPDVWGRVRRSVRAARENAQASAADLVNVKLSLQAELALDYFQMRGMDRQKAILDQTVDAYRKSLQLNQQLLHAGLGSELEVEQARTQLESTVAQDQDVAVARAQDEHAIAVLTGQPPATLTIPPRSGPYAPPPPIPPGLPSQLLERRPDVAAAERRMASANEQIGIARSAYYPTFSLTGTGGFESARPGNWFTGPSSFWSAGLSAADMLIDWGQRRATNTAAEANYQGTVATYRQTVLTAYQEVEDNLAALHILEQEADTEKRTVASAQRQEAIAMRLYNEGLDPYINVIQAQSVVLSSEVTRAGIDTRRMAASVLLIKALGGGWNTNRLPRE